MGLDVYEQAGHALACFALTVNSHMVFGNRKRVHIFLALTRFGPLIEILHGYIRKFEFFFDLMANTIGIVSGILFLSIFGRWIARVLKRFGITHKI